MPPDYLMLFDHWWYFLERLRNGNIAQWNPFSGLGRVAVEWNHLPTSMFTPFLLFSELTLDKFYFLYRVGMFLSLLSIYLAGRIMGYGRYLPLLPVGLIVMGNDRYPHYQVLFSTYLFFYPIAMAMLIKFFSEESYNKPWLLGMFVILMSLSLTGYRLEGSVHTLTFLLIICVVLAFLKQKCFRNCFYFLMVGLLTIALIVAANSWHFAFLYESLLSSGRAAQTIDLKSIFNLNSLIWLKTCVAFRPTLILIALNILILLTFHLKKLSSENLVTNKFIVAYIVLQLTFLKTLPILANKIFGIDLSSSFIDGGNYIPNWKYITSIDYQLICSKRGLLSIILSVLFLLSISNKISRQKLTIFLIVLFTGFYSAEYTNTAGLYIPTVIAGFLPCGAVRLWLTNRSWIIISLFIFHIVGEVGAYFMMEAFNITWLLRRASLCEVPFKIILIIETICLVTDLLKKLPKMNIHLFNLSNYFNLNRSKLNYLVAVCSIVMFIFWFPARNIPENKFQLDNRQISEAYHNSMQARSYHLYEQTGLKRIHVEGVHNFLPAYSKQLNTAAVYSSEIPMEWKEMFLGTYNNLNYDSIFMGNKFFPGHPEINPALAKFMIKVLGRNPRYYHLEVITYLNGDSDITEEKRSDIDKTLNKNFCAEVGSKTKRFFMSSNVIKIKDHIIEKMFLKNIIETGRCFSDQITTSDERFLNTYNGVERDLNNQYTIDIIKDDPEEIILNVSSKNDSNLVLMDTWSRGWKAFVDGNETAIYKGYIGVRFIEVKQGKHLIIFKYQIPGLVGYVIISIVSWFLIILLAIASCFLSNRTNIQA